ncbi:hypothetical protein FIA58_006140 [Flavobacterium jejuense]|uniref:Uncharacterized protein n=1 Tax=Flavobacterium jejuense TaxID=1544455 RepID=A0ABX0ITV0_9FLAO|nr:hypothetical protein [Flavobacterium jejuense]NHN25254.1 hypothetical protein [Flavobacterium jejuense]
MTEVFTTNIQNTTQADRILKILKNSFSELKINFDFNDFDTTETRYPCTHSILRVEGILIDLNAITSILNKFGFMCDVLEDKICK